MPQHWRCANGHTWVGELGALTFCPECGSTDVYEVRPPEPTPVTRRAKSPPRSDETLHQPAETGQGTFVFDPAAAAQRPAPSGDTISQATEPRDDTLEFEPEDEVTGATALVTADDADDPSRTADLPAAAPDDATALDTAAERDDRSRTAQLPPTG